MNEEYIIGRITVHFGVDIVSLAHIVQGRVSYMDLVEGDHIEVKVGDCYKAISTTNVLDTLVDNKPCKNDKWKRGSSLYEGSEVRVKLDLQGNRQAVLTEKSLKINKVITALKQGLINYEEATQALLSFELEDED